MNAKAAILWILVAVIVLELGHVYLGIPPRSIIGSVLQGTENAGTCYHDGTRWVGCRQ